MSSYAAQYDLHLSQLRAHLTQDLLPASFIPPSGYWTSSEKAAFFHGLRIHSRLRPDLIAACVKTKTAVDVGAYLDVLEDAAAATPPVPKLRTTLECAMEVSDSWIQYEEAEAQILAEMEPQWARKAEQAKRTQFLERDNVSDAWKRKQEDIWQKEDALAALDTLHLNALEKLIRRTAVPNDREPSPSPDSRESSPDPVEALSPGSRRRHTKRLYMRKKRAEATDTEPDLAPSKLVAGRKPGRALTRKSRASKYGARKITDKFIMNEVGVDEDGTTVVIRRKRKRTSDSSSSDDDDDEPVVRRFKISGATAPYRALAHLEQCGIDGKSLVDSQLDILNFSVVAKRMGSQRQGEAQTQPTIAFDTVTLLRDILIDFVTPLVHAAISLREKEVALKKDIKIWRMDAEDRIMVGNVQDAIALQGAKNSVVHDVMDSDSDSDSNASDSDSEGGEQRYVEDKPDLPLRLNVAREVAPLSIRWNYDDDDTSLLPEQDDEDALVAELKQERKLEKKERKQEIDEEQALWAAAGEHPLNMYHTTSI